MHGKGLTADDAEQWDAAVEELRAYAQRTGSTYPSRATPMADGRDLCNWVRNARAAHTSGTLSRARTEQLETIPGWRWRTRAVRGTATPRPRSQAPRRKPWDQRIAEAEAFIAEHGMLPSFRSATPGERSLRFWLYEQARDQSLPPDRRQKIDELTDPALTPEWRTAFNATMQAYRTPQAARHRRWIANQNRDTLSAEQRRLMDTLPDPYLTARRGRPPAGDRPAD